MEQSETIESDLASFLTRKLRSYVSDHTLRLSLHLQQLKKLASLNKGQTAGEGQEQDYQKITMVRGKLK